MATPAQPCNCVPYVNRCCCGTQNGITVVQPLCQNLPDGSVVNNPAYVASLNKSFWTYKFIEDCASTTRAISNFGIPICLEINAQNITVEEKIDGCGVYVEVDFELIENDPNFGSAPEGFQYLKINIDDRYQSGVSVEYRVSIIGDYPEDVQSIDVKTATLVYTFGCANCYIVPGCVSAGKLVVSKTCSHTIVDNQATLYYEIHVDNVGETALDPVEFEDILFIPTQLVLGAITVDPVSLSVDTGTPGQVIVSGGLGPIEPGGRVTITYSILIASVSEPGSYLVNNTATATASGTKDSASCQTNLDVIQLRADKCCSIDGSSVTFNITLSSVGNSPDVTVDAFDHMEIPAGLTTRLTNLGGCEAYYSGTTNPVPTNTDINGPVDFDIVCMNVSISAGSSLTKSIVYSLICSSVVGITTVTNIFTDVSPVSTNLIYLGTLNLPVTAAVNVELTQICTNPCQ